MLQGAEELLGVAMKGSVSLGALMAAVKFGMDIKKNGNGHNGNGRADEQSRNAAVQRVVDRVDDAERAIQGNVNDTRHSVNNWLQQVVGKLEEIRIELARGR